MSKGSWLTSSCFSQPLRDSLDEDGVRLAHWRIRRRRRQDERRVRGGVQARRRERGWGRLRRRRRRRGRRMKVADRRMHGVHRFVRIHFYVFGVLLSYTIQTKLLRSRLSDKDMLLRYLLRKQARNITTVILSY